MRRRIYNLVQGLLRHCLRALAPQRVWSTSTSEQEPCIGRAAFDTRTGKVYACTARRKRQVEFIALLKLLDREIPSSVTHIRLVLDNASIHKGKQVQAWLQSHPRFTSFFVPVHCSWMNQVEQWFSILQRKRLRISDFSNVDHLAERLLAFVTEWNAHAHPFNWSAKSALKVMAKWGPQSPSSAA